MTSVINGCLGTKQILTLEWIGLAGLGPKPHLAGPKPFRWGRPRSHCLQLASSAAAAHWYPDITLESLGHGYRISYFMHTLWVTSLQRDRFSPFKHQEVCTLSDSGEHLPVLAESGPGLRLHWCLDSISTSLPLLKSKASLFLIRNLLSLVPNCEATSSLKVLKPRGGVFPPVGTEQFQKGSSSSQSQGQLVLFVFHYPRQGEPQASI